MTFKGRSLYRNVSYILGVTYISLFVFLLNNKGVNYLSTWLSLLAAIGLVGSVAYSAYMLKGITIDSKKRLKQNRVWLLASFLTFFIPWLPIFLLRVAGGRNNDSFFRVAGGVIVFLQLLTFNIIPLLFFDAEISADAASLPVYLLAFFSLVLLLVRFVLLLPSKFLESLNKFHKRD
ncbi:MAG: hypothetical protein ACKOW9_05385 [Candidatus Paceibacterota bacterium]